MLRTSIGPQRRNHHVASYYEGHMVIHGGRSTHAVAVMNADIWAFNLHSNSKY